MKKVRILTMIFAFIMAFSAVSFTAFAEGEAVTPSTSETTESTEPTQPSVDYKVSGDFQYKDIDDKTVEIVGFTGKGEECSIPAKITEKVGETTVEKAVVSVASGVVKNNSVISVVKIPGSVKNFSADSFIGCVALKNIIVSSGDLQHFDVEYCSSLEIITLPENIKTIGKLENCVMLQRIDINGAKSSLKSVDGVVYSADGKTLVKYPAGKKAARFAVPATVTEISDYAFYQTGANVTEIYVPSTVVKMGANTFNQSTVKVLFQADKTPAGCADAVKKLTVEHNQINIGAPKKVTSAQNATTIALTWDKVTGADGYAVYYLNAKGKWTHYANTANNTFTFTKLKAGTKYSFAVRSVVKTSAGLKGSQNFITYQAATAPVATSKVVYANTESSITLTWAKVAGADGYAIYYKNSKGWQHYKNTTATTFKFEKLKAYTKYTFAVRTLIKASDKIVAGAFTEITATTNLATPIITAKQTDSKTVKFKWSSCPGASHYQVYYKINNSDWYIMPTPNNQKYYTDLPIVAFPTTGMGAGVKITLAVRAFRSEGGKVVLKSDYKPVTITLK